MKISVVAIISGHLATLYDAESKKLSYSDCIIFYIIPVIFGVASYYIELKFRPDVYNVSITFFGIFLALLLNIQVAIFGIFQRKWDVPADSHLATVQRRQLIERQKLLGELNTNISYLIVVSSVSLISILLFYIFQVEQKIGPSITTALYVHFILTFIMIVKRSYALFQKEYANTAS